MFIFWASSSCLFFFVGMFVFFFLSKIFFFSWVGLELMTWAMFFLFSIYWNKSSQELLFIFFFVQSLSSILWLISSFFKENLAILNDSSYLELDLFWVSISVNEILIIGSLFLKMGLFSGHVWMWQMYLNKMTYPVVLISTLQKIYPMMMMVLFFQDYSNSHFFFKILLLMSIFIVSTKSWKGFSIFFFLFLSSILQYSMILLSSFFFLFEMSSIFMVSYWFLFLITVFLLKEFKLEGDLSGQSGNNSSLLKSKGELLFITLSMSGYPPMLGFFMKLFLLMKVSSFTISILGLILLISNFIYMSFIFFNITKTLIKYNALSSSEFFLQEKNKNKESFFFFFFWFYLSSFFLFSMF